MKNLIKANNFWLSLNPPVIWLRVGKKGSVFCVVTETKLHNGKISARLVRFGVKVGRLKKTWSHYEEFATAEELIQSKIKTAAEYKANNNELKVNIPNHFQYIPEPKKGNDKEDA